MMKKYRLLLLLACLLSMEVYVKAQTIISTFATSAQGINNPQGLVFDKGGNLVVANTGNNTIIKIAPDGTVSPFCSDPLLNSPRGIVFDKADNLFVANYGSNKILKINSIGEATVFADSLLNQPIGLAFDTWGNLYAANYSGGLISKITPTGAVSTIAYGTFGANTTLKAIAIDNNNDLYVASTTALNNLGNENIYKIALRSNSKLGYVPHLSGLVTSFPDSYGLSVDSAQNIIQSGKSIAGSTYSNFSLKALYSSLNFSSNSISYGATAFDAQGYLYAYYIEANSIVKISAVDLVIKADKSAACIGQPITFTAQTNNAGNAPTFQWKKNGVIVGSNSKVYVDPGLSSSSDVISCTLSSSLTDVSPNSITNSLSLTVYDTTAKVDSATAIGSYTWNATTYHQSGIYYYTYNNANGCPIKKKLVLKLYPSCSSTDTVKVTTSAANYKWHGTTYTKSGTYSFDSLNVAGCDSLMRLELQLIPACPNSVWVGETNSPYQIDYSINANFWGTGIGPNGNYFLTKGGQNSTVFYVNDTIFNISSPTQTGNGTPSCKAPAAFNNYASQMAILPSTASQICYTANQAYYVRESLLTSKCQVLGSQLVIGKAQAFSIATPGTYTIPFEGVSSIKNITIIGKPVVTISANVTDNKLIKGQSVVFTSAITNQGDYLLTTWLKNGDVVSYDDTYTDATLNDGDVITCVVTSYLQLGSKTNVSSNQLKMSVCTPNSSTTNQTICSNQLPYTWNGQTITVAGTFQAILTNAGGCDSTATLVLTVNSSVTPSVTITSSPAMPIAKGTNVVFTAVPTNGGTGTTYEWYKNALKLNDTDSILQNASVEDEDTIKCVITSNAACVTSTTAESNKIVVVEIPVCATPTKFSVTGGGVYCTSGSGLPIGLSSSEVGVNYQLLIPSPKNPNQWATLGLPIAGTGSAINFGNRTAATYRVLAKTAVGSCQDTMTGKATITSTNMAIWAGNASNDLGNAANIDGCALSTSVDFQIASGLSVYPVLTGTVSVKSVNIQAGATLSVSGTLNVSGSFTNNGTPSLGSGTVVLNGTTGTVSGSSVFNNLKIAGNYSIGNTTADKIDVTGILNVESGTFTTLGKLTLKSTASKTALIQENGGSINGNINMERYVGGSTGYHHLSSPVSNNTVATWGKYFNIVGKDGLRSGTKGFTPATLQEYRESANTKALLDSGYYNYTNGDAVTANGKGLSAWFVKAPITLVSTGGATSGTVTVPVTFAGTNATTRGWNLIGNPYPSPINWSALRSLNPGVWGDQACYIWKPTKGVNGQWQTYNGTVGTNGVGNVIASSQAFFVLVNQSTNLTFNNSIRTTDLSPTFFSTQQHKQLRLQLVNPANLSETDEVVAYTKAGIAQPVASVKPPMPAEATNASLSFVHEGKPAAIEALADFKAGDELALNISTPVAGMYLLKVGEFNHNIPAYLKDAKTGNLTELKAGAEIAIATEATTTNTRYSVVFGRPAAAVAAANNAYKVFAAKKAIQVTSAVAVSNAKVVVYNTLGQQIAIATMNGTRLTIPVSASTNAAYVVKIAGETVGKVIVH